MAGKRPFILQLR